MEIIIYYLPKLLNFLFCKNIRFIKLFTLDNFCTYKQTHIVLKFKTMKKHLIYISILGSLLTLNTACAQMNQVSNSSAITSNEVEDQSISPDVCRLPSLESIKEKESPPTCRFIPPKEEETMEKKADNKKPYECGRYIRIRFENQVPNNPDLFHIDTDNVLNVAVGNANPQKYTVRLLSMDKRIVIEEVVLANNVNYLANIDTKGEALKSGYYILEIANKDQLIYNKIYKQ